MLNFDERDLLADAESEVLTGPETDRLSEVLRGSVQQGIGRQRSALAFLRATRPAR